MENASFCFTCLPSLLFRIPHLHERSKPECVIEYAEHQYFGMMIKNVNFTIIMLISWVSSFLSCGSTVKKNSLMTNFEIVIDLLEAAYLRVSSTWAAKARSKIPYLSQRRKGSFLMKEVMRNVDCLIHRLYCNVDTSLNVGVIKVWITFSFLA